MNRALGRGLSLLSLSHRVRTRPTEIVYFHNIFFNIGAIVLYRAKIKVKRRVYETDASSHSEIGFKTKMSVHLSKKETEKNAPDYNSGFDNVRDATCLVRSVSIYNRPWLLLGDAGSARR